MMNGKSKSIAIVYHYIAHYRKPIFVELCASNEVNYTIFADEKTNISSLKVLSRIDSSCGPIINKKWKLLKNIWITKDVLWQKGVINIVFDKNYDGFIFLGNMYFISTWLAVILAKLNGKKVYYWTHGVRNNKRGMKEYIRFKFYCLADGLFLYGNAAKNILESKKYPSEKMHVIYNSLNYAEQNNFFGMITQNEKQGLRESLYIREKEKVILTSCRLTKPRKLSLLINALAIVNKNNINSYTLLIIGDGPERTSLEREVCKLNLVDNVVFYGECYDERMLAAIFSIAHVFVIPGDIGLSAIHSLTYGVPVITHDNFNTHKPEFEAIIDGVNGSFYKENDIESLAEKIIIWSVEKKHKERYEYRRIISKYYNPGYQKKIINHIIVNS